ncbi:unnamed protein product [Clonostachys rhizophaga]|uniref:Heterokaryon incompatibility domain-containing protein n=1 Tax=Clonostachys rhizophaga TaxID=160324 RepID=A0A9N9VW03_9HYPO|nr:unnamed protein product [Clonostachys rhizophaga]
MSEHKIPPFNGPEFQIRLLRLSPKNAVSFNATLTGKRTRLLLQGSLEVFDFDSAPPFIGLSYVWGSQENKQPFLLNGDETHITKNLAIALEHLRDVHQEITLWVDALCIDQRNDQEKSDQVSRMRDIYKRAESVRVWLGPSSYGVDLVMDRFEKLGRGILNMGMQEAVFSSPLWDFNTLKQVLADKPQDSILPLLDIFWKLQGAFTDLTLREWWSRIWTLQEFVVAKDVVFQCGKKLQNLDVFEIAVVSVMKFFFFMKLSVFQTWREKRMQPDNYSYERGRGLMRVQITERFTIRRGYVDTQDHSRHSMGYLLETLYVTWINGGELKATDPRDKIYALLGLAWDSDSLGIIPDYKKSIQDIYTEVVGKVIAKHDLSLLLNCKYNPSSGLPSWVPDFRQGLAMSARLTLDDEFCAGSAGIVANGAQPLDGSPNILGVKGSRIGRVLDTGTSLMISEQDSLDFSGIRRFISEIEGFLLQSASMDICPYGATNGDYEGHGPTWLQEARYRIPVADAQTNADFHSVGRATASSKAKFDSLMEFYRLYDEMAGQGQSLSPALKASIMKVWELGFNKWGHYFGIVQDNHGRKPFITTNGYVGVGPEEMEVGDDIFIFLGATVPYVLRAAQGSSRSILIGNAYAHGVMDGEFMGKRPLIDLHLE